MFWDDVDGGGDGDAGATVPPQQPNKFAEKLFS